MSKDSNLTRVKNLLAKYPNTKAEIIVRQMGVSKVYAYNLLSSARKQLGMRINPDGTWKLKERMQATPRDEKAVELLTHMKETPKIVEDNVNHPPHYKVGGIETIDFIEAKGLGYNLGNVIKYVTRAEHKGNLREDLLKARWYIERELAKTVSK